MFHTPPPHVDLAREIPEFGALHERPFASIRGAANGRLAKARSGERSIGPRPKNGRSVRSTIVRSSRFCSCERLTFRNSDFRKAPIFSNFSGVRTIMRTLDRFTRRAKNLLAAK